MCFPSVLGHSSSCHGQAKIIKSGLIITSASNCGCIASGPMELCMSSLVFHQRRGGYIFASAFQAGLWDLGFLKASLAGKTEAKKALTSSDFSQF